MNFLKQIKPMIYLILEFEVNVSTPIVYKTLRL
jgi:hypothetical protein